MKPNSWDKCKNCGGDFGVHRWDTNQCPFNGEDQTMKRTPLYMTSVFETEIEDIEVEVKNYEIFKTLEDKLKFLSVGEVTLYFDLEKNLWEVRLFAGDEFEHEELMVALDDAVKFSEESLEEEIKAILAEKEPSDTD